VGILFGGVLTGSRGLLVDLKLPFERAQLRLAQRFLDPLPRRGRDEYGNPVDGVRGGESRIATPATRPTSTEAEEVGAQVPEVEVLWNQS